MGSWDSQKVLDKYIHDYMVRKKMYETAEIFAEEAKVDTSTVAVDSAEGFLKEWWGFFWDSYTSVDDPIAQNRPPPTLEEVMQLFQSMFPNHQFSLPAPAESMQPVDPSAPAPNLPGSSNQQAVDNIATQTPGPVLPAGFGMTNDQRALGKMPMSSTEPQQPANSPANNPGTAGTPQAPTEFAKLFEREYLKHFGRGDLAATSGSLDAARMSQARIHDQNRGGSGRMVREMPTPFAKKYERGFANNPVRERLAAKLEKRRLEAERRSQPPSSSQFSPQAQHGFQPAEVVEKIEQQRIMTEVQQKQRGDIQTRVGRGRRRGTSGGTSKGVVIREEGGATLAGLEDVADTGKGELIQQKPILAHHFWGVGSSSTATRHQLSNSSASVHKQQEQILMSGGNINEQYHLAESEAQKLGKLTIQALGSSSNVAGASSGMDFHLHSESPNNAQGNKTQKQRGRKKKDSPVVVAVVSSSDGKDAEVEKPVNENIQPHFSLENDNPHDTTTPFSSFLRVLSTLDENAWEGFSFTEYGRLNSPQNKLLCCDFSTTGKLLSGAGYEKKILLLNTENFSVEFIDAHVDTITDVRFRPNSTIFATSSFDKTVQVWDASKRKRLRSKLDGHPLRVMSLDFHPMRTDLLYSCDSNNQMRIWNFQRNTCTQIAQGLGGRLRFQPRYGDFLASSMGNLVNLIDVETNTITNRLEGHLSNVRSLCWDTSGKYIVSVSEDSARIWTITSGGRCVHHLLSRGNAFESCTFHPGYSQLTVIGMNEKLELWNPTAGNRTRSYDAHAGLITALADSPHTETIASASHDGWIKLWR